MLRALILTTICFVLSHGAAVQNEQGVLRITVVVMDAERRSVPVPRHALLVSENPPTAPPRRIQTGLDGTASLRLRGGNYTVESDQPVSVQGKTYQWTQIVDIAPERETVLQLTAENAESDAASADRSTPSTVDADASSLLIRWRDSVVTVWSPTASASGFVVDANGLIVTNQRVIGTASAVEVQLSPVIKVTAPVLEADPVRDVAVLRIDPNAMASVASVPLGCGRERTIPIEERQQLFAIGAPFRRLKDVISGRVSVVEGRFIVADFVLGNGGEGGPVFAAGGTLVGITSLSADNDTGRRGDARVVRIEEVCASIASAALRMKDGAVPDGRHLPVDPLRPFPIEALKNAAARSPGLSSYRVSTSSYDVTFITPVLLYAAEQSPKMKESRTGGRGAPDPRTIKPLDDFSNWSAYVTDFPPVLMIRVTPKLVESFWTKFARGAAQTQGVSVPPIKRFKPGFDRLQAFCGDVEVAPIHPFKLEQRASDTDGIYEGLYVFDSGAIGPSCGEVKLVLYSEKEPNRGETRVVEPKAVQQVWDDFAPYRTEK